MIKDVTYLKEAFGTLEDLNIFLANPGRTAFLTSQKLLWPVLELVW